MAKKDKQLSLGSVPIVSGTNLTAEAMRLFEDHKKIFHDSLGGDCRICRSMRRTALGGMK